MGSRTGPTSSPRRLPGNEPPRRVTVSRGIDAVSPAYSPDGRRIVYVVQQGGRAGAVRRRCRRHECRSPHPVQLRRPDAAHRSLLVARCAVHCVPGRDGREHADLYCESCGTAARPGNTPTREGTKIRPGHPTAVTSSSLRTGPEAGNSGCSILNQVVLDSSPTRRAAQGPAPGLRDLLLINRSDLSSTVPEDTQ